MANEIGTETHDAPFFTAATSSACDTGRYCRYSDANFYTKGIGVTSTQGGVAKPTNSSGSVTIGGEFRITAEGGLPSLGLTLNKVGRTSGWSQGDVTDTCVDVYTTYYGNDLQFKCQYGVQATQVGGDSGAPVFRITNSPATDDVTLYGIATATIDGDEFYFSYLGNIFFELEPSVSWDSCNASFSC
ncbi:MAG: hypothetical protein WD208_06575 [Dehalococcoidia bacterium]